jgi:hypothetical protein
MDFIKVLSKGLLGFVTGLAAVAVFGIAQALTDYKPVVCTDVIITECTPRIITTAYYAIIPAVSAALVALGNFLKHRGK